MRIRPILWIAGVVLFAACQPQSTDFDPQDSAAIAEINSLVEKAMEGARNADADRVLEMAEGASDLTFITGDVMLSGVETIRAAFEDTYEGIEGQSQTVIDSKIRLLSRDVAIVTAVAEGTYTDRAGWTSEPVGMGHTLVFVRQDGEWRVRHAHQSIAF